MTESEAIEQLKTMYPKTCKMIDGRYTGGYDDHTSKGGTALDIAIKALEQSPKMEQFAKWVATEIFDDMWEYNKDSFAEIACRKLAKLGIVRAKGDEWELVESEEEE